MRQRRRSYLGVALLLLLSLAVLYWASGREARGARRALEIALSDARRSGFNLDYSEARIPRKPEAQARARAMTNAIFALPLVRRYFYFPSMLPMTHGSARCGWQNPAPWDEIAAALVPMENVLDLAALAILDDSPSGLAPIRSVDSRVPYVSNLPTLSQLFTLRLQLALHERNHRRAWTNLMIVTALATQLQPEPVEAFCLDRGALVQLAFNATWEALQSSIWSDEELAKLADCWARLQTNVGAAEVPALELARERRSIADHRRESSTNQIFASELPRLSRQFRQSPWETVQVALDLLRFGTAQRHYTEVESYWEEVTLVEFYQARDALLRRDLAQADWVSVRRLPELTNRMVSPRQKSVSGGASSFQTMFAARENMLAVRASTQGLGKPTLASQLAETEALRRLLLAGIAVERWRRVHSQWPGALEDVAGLLPDSVTGGTFHYRLDPGREPVIYSVGVDLEDNGGEIRPDEIHSSETDRRPYDLVWPRRATAEELKGLAPTNAALRQLFSWGAFRHF